MSDPSQEEALRALGLPAPGRRRRTLAIALAAAAVVTGVVAWRIAAAPSGPSYRTAKVERGDLAVTVTATGTLQGIGTVEVGAEISGWVAQVLVNDNDRVKAGTVLASLDLSQLQARLEEASAQVRAAQAALVNARATAAESKQRADRATGLAGKGLLSRQDLEASQATAARSDAAVASAEAQRTVNEASLRAARSALDKAEIRAPIDGVVLSRQVEPGQTVVASLQAPVLFVLAQDLDRMELEVQIDEADVGTVQAGQKATFTVDAYPDRTFAAAVVEVRLYPTAAAAGSTSTVVTYQATLTVANPERELRPGMTATATIATNLRTGVLLIPNAALRFTPPELRAAPGMRMMPIPGLGRGPQGGQQPEVRGQVVWVLKDGRPVSVPVRPGASDGRLTEIAEGEIVEGTDVLVDVADARG